MGVFATRLTQLLTVSQCLQYCQGLTATKLRVSPARNGRAGFRAAHIAHAAQQLQQHDAVIIPVADGGYVLIGLHASCPTVFTEMAWSTSVVAGETLRRMAVRNWSVWAGPLLHDIDEPADLVHVPPQWRPGPSVIG